jgi:hypothetical protein
VYPCVSPREYSASLREYSASPLEPLAPSLSATREPRLLRECINIALVPNEYPEYPQESPSGLRKHSVSTLAYPLSPVDNTLRALSTPEYPKILQVPTEYPSSTPRYPLVSH